MDVQVGDGLSRWGAIIDPYVVSIRAKRILKVFLCLLEGLEDGRFFAGRGVEKRGHMAPGDDERMAPGNGEGITDRHDEVVFIEDPLRIDAAKRTIWQGHSFNPLLI
jgi:hypothetical protein